MPKLILLDVPAGFPCVAAAMSALPAAKEKGMDEIEVAKGHTCRFKVVELEKLVAKARRGESWEPPKSMMGGVAMHEHWGNEFEPRLPVWPGFAVN